MPGSRRFLGKPSKQPAVVAVSVLLLALAAVAAADEDPNQPNGKQPIAEQVMAELRTAGAARVQLLKEKQQWAIDREKLELLKSTVLGEAKRHRSVAAKARQTEAELRERLEQHKAGQQRLKSVEGVVDALCERLEKALAGLANRSLPGLVPPDRAARITEPGRRLAVGVDRLHAVRRQTKRAAVEVVSGSVEGRTLAVKLLRVGGVAAWWLSLDGKQAGTAAVRDGQVLLSAAAEPRDVQAILKAFAIAEGRGTPDWALLPVKPEAAKD